MQTRKKQLAVLLALVMLFALPACSKEGKQGDLFDRRALFEQGKPDDAQGSGSVSKTEPTQGSDKPETEAESGQQATDAPRPTASPASEAVSMTLPEAGAAFAAIGDPEIDTSIVGYWVYPIDYASIMKDQSEPTDSLDEMNQAVLEALEGLQLDAMLDLREDGSFCFGLDEESVRTATERIVAKTVEVMIPMLPSLMGMSEEELAAAVEAQGMTMEEFADQMMASLQKQMNPDEMAANMLKSNQEGLWRYKDGKLYMIPFDGSVDVGRYMTIELNDDSLTVTENTMEQDAYRSMLPMVYHRK